MRRLAGSQGAASGMADTMARSCAFGGTLSCLKALPPVLARPDFGPKPGKLDINGRPMS
jgi:hypothetical protein